MTLGDSAVYRTILARLEANGDLGWVNGSTPVGAEALASLADGSPVLTGGSGVAGFDPAGAPRWFQVIHGANSSGEALVTLPDGSTFLAGHAMGWTTFWPGELAPAGGWDLFAGRVAPGGALPWVRGAGGAGDDLADAAALVSDGTVAVLARSTGSATFGAGEPGAVTLVPPVPAPPSWWWRATGPERGGARGPGYRGFPASHQAFTPSAMAAANLDSNARVAAPFSPLCPARPAWCAGIGPA